MGWFQSNVKPTSKMSTITAEYINKRKKFEQNIDNKLNEYVNSVIRKEYSIKDTIPELQKKIKKIQNYDFVKDCFKDIVENRRPVLLYCDYDNDWLSAGTAMSEFLDMFNVPYKTVFPSRKDDGYGLKVINLKQNKNVVDFLEKYEDSKTPVYVCSLDNWINNDEVNRILKEKWFTYCSIDHHQPEAAYTNEFCMNPHLNPENIKDEENLCTGLLVYWFCATMFEHFEKEKLVTAFSGNENTPGVTANNLKALKQDFLNGNIDLAILSTLSDYMRLDWVNRAIVKNFSNVLLRKARTWIKQLINVNSEFMQMSKIYETLNMNVISLLNAVGRLKNMEMAYSFLRMEEGSMTVQDLLLLNENKKEIVNVVVKKITDWKDQYIGDWKTLIFNDDDMDAWVASIISTRMAMSLQAVTMIGHSDGHKSIRYSIRSPFYWHELKKEFQILWYSYKWHNVAWVVEIDIGEKDNFELTVKNHFNNQKLVSEWNVVLDTIDDWDMISTELLDKIYSFGPYWAGLKEPNFRIVWEFLKWTNQQYIWASSSWKMQVMSMKVGNKVLRVNNKSWTQLTENNIKNSKSIIVKLAYPYPGQNKINLDLVEVE